MNLKFCGIAITYNRFVFTHRFGNDFEVIYYKPYHAMHILIPASSDEPIVMFHRRVDPCPVDPARLNPNNT